MVKTREDDVLGSPADETAGCCSVEAVVSIDERGQMILPKEIRDKAGIKAGDKLAIMSIRHGSSVCCISLVKAEALTAMVKSLLGPMMKEVF